MAEEEEEEAEVNIGLLLTGFCLTEASKNRIISLKQGMLERAFLLLDESKLKTFKRL